MIRNIKALSLALVAVFAMCAVVASSASAVNFTASSYPATGTGEQPAGEPHVFTVQGQKVTCTKAHFVGELGAASESINVTPTYEGCTAFGFANSQVHMNGCYFEFTVGNGVKGGVHIRCPVGQSITITAPAGASPPCVVHIPPQTPTVDVVFYETRTSPHRIRVISSVSVVHANVTKQTFLCPLTSNTTDETGKYEGSVDFAGTGGVTVDIG